MVIKYKWIYSDEEGEARGENSAEKRAEELPANEKSKKPRGNRVKRVVPVANADTLSRHETEYDGADDQSKRNFKSISELGGANSKNGSRRSRVAPEESFEEQRPQHFEQLHPQPPKGSHQSDDDKKPKEKTENPSAEKFLDESALLRICHCNCDNHRRAICKEARNFRGVSAVSADTSTDLVRVTGKMDVKELLIHLKTKLKKNVEVVPAENADYPEKDRECATHIANITDNASRKTEVHPNVQGRQNLEKTKLTLPQPRKGDRNDNEVTDMVHLKIRMHCHEGCIPQTQRTAGKFPGVTSVEVDASKHLVIVVGTINVKELVAYLEEKLKRRVEVVPVQNNSLPGDNKEVEVTKIETLKEPAAAREDGWHNDVEMKKEVKKKAEEIKNKQKVKDVNVEGKKYSLNGGYDGTEEDKGDKKGNEGVEDNVKEAKGYGYISHDGEKHKELEREGDRQTYFQNYGKQDDLRYGPSNYDNVNEYPDSEMFSDENPNSCAIM